jgi:hypothetical protein
MKKQKGITLMALTIYVVIFTIVIGIVSTLTSYFYKNIMHFDETTKSYSEINKFNMYFLQDIKENGTVVANLINDNNEENYIGITLYNSNNYETYIYEFKAEDNAIYRNGNIICKNIKLAQFKIEDENIICIYVETMGVANQVKTMKYAINN